MKKSKKIIALLLCVLTIAHLSVPTAFAVYFKDYVRPVESKNKIMSINTDRFGSTTTSYFYNYKDQYYAVNVTDKVIVTKYCLAFNNLGETTIKFELPLWGGFYSGKTYNYMVFGQENPNEKPNTEVYRIVKYDKSFKRISSVSITGKQCEAIKPFAYGSLDMCESADGKELTIHTTRLRYKTSDGSNHQSQFTIILNTDTMTPINDLQAFQKNHVSHSFNQFVQYDNSSAVLVDHGDAYPRSVVLSKRLSDGTYSQLDLFAIPGETGANCTGVSVGGFEISKNNYIVSINTVDHKKVTRYDDFTIYGLDKEERDAVLLISAKSNTSTSAVKKVYLTDYVNKNLHATAPYLVKLGDTKFMAIWKEYSISKKIDDWGDSYYSYAENGVKYVTIDENGNKLEQVQTLAAPCNLSDCQPIYYGGKIVWYYDESQTQRRICTIVTGSTSKHSHPLNYYPAVASTCSQMGNIEYYYCVTCEKFFSDLSGTTTLTYDQTKLAKLDHKPGDWQVVTKPTEYNTGKKVKKCTVCNAVVQEEIMPKIPTIGDVDINGIINSTDALMVLQHTVGKSRLTGEKFTRADVDSNSVVNSTDALKILRYTVGKIKEI